MFLKFYAPWCGHCKKIKPDWDRLGKDFENSKKGLVAEIDCAGKGKPLCEKNGVSGYPRLMYGRDDNLQDYHGERSYEAMKTFADERLGASCDPGNLDLCDAERRSTLEKFMRRSPEKLDEMITLADKQVKQAEYRFKVIEHNISDRIIRAEQRKNKKVSDIRKKGGMPRGQGVVELSLENWEQLTEGKTLFVKFFAPWCGHCKTLAPTWARLAQDYTGTRSGLVAEVDCTGKGQTLCEKHEVTGYPRLLYGDPEDGDLTKYTGMRDYDSLKEFALEELGETCSSGNIDLCEEDQKVWVKDFADLSDEERKERQKGTDGKVAKKERKFEELQWNLTGEIDIAEAKMKDQVKAIKGQGLPEAKLVQAWNQKQPEGFWKPPPPPPPPPPEPKGFLGPLEEVIFEVAGYEVTGITCLALVLALLFPLLFMSGSKKIEPLGRSCEARHILMKDKDEILKVKERIDAGESFEDLAAECSFCNSKGEGGSLGLRHEGSMEPAINAVCFDPKTELGATVGPIATKFGFHLLRVDTRTGFEGDAADEVDEGEDQDEAEGEKETSEAQPGDDDSGAKKRKNKQSAENGKEAKGKEDVKKTDEGDKKKNKGKKKDK